MTEGGELNIIDQTLLPGEIKRINLNTKEEIWEAIKIIIKERKETLSIS